MSNRDKNVEINEWLPMGRMGSTHPTVFGSGSSCLGLFQIRITVFFLMPNPENYYVSAGFIVVSNDIAA
jgi:hypothetical protein